MTRSRKVRLAAAVMEALDMMRKMSGLMTQPLKLSWGLMMKIYLSQRKNTSMRLSQTLTKPSKGLGTWKIVLRS